MSQRRCLNVQQWHKITDLRSMLLKTFVNAPDCRIGLSLQSHGRRTQLRALVGTILYTFHLLFSLPLVIGMLLVPGVHAVSRVAVRHQTPLT